VTNEIDRFVSISAGDNHLLALTSGGRTFAHPINMSANTYGQLGFRKFDVPDHSLPTGHAHLHPTRVAVELTPKSVSDPYANASRARRQTPEEPIAAQPELDDSGIRFSDKLFEIPALKGIKVGAIAAGSRSSFVKSSDGRVLGWGANQFG
jgi:alpha-tubulin suppressor-like RCC1 family protein